MNYYLVDYENVKNDGLNGIDLLNNEAHVFILYTENSKTLTFDTANKIAASHANIYYQKVIAGSKNALDFQLASYLGYLIAQDSGSNEYYIVTKDTGYKCLVDFWSKEKKKVSLIPNFTVTKNVPMVVPQSEAWASDPEVRKIIDNYKTKLGINNALVKKYGSTRGGEIYKSIKSLIKDKKGS